MYSQSALSSVALRVRCEVTQVRDTKHSLQKLPVALIQLGVKKKALVNELFRIPLAHE